MSKDTETRIEELIGRIPGSCSCGTIGPSPSLHDEACGYRHIALCLEELETQKKPTEP